MAWETIHCPYCNAQVMVPAAAPPGRVHCPRCGEAFAYRAAGQGGDEGAAWERAAAEMPLPDGAGGPPAPGRSNRWLALVIVGAMAAIAAGALGFALMTRPVRRSHDLAEGTALAFLPRDANLVASVQVGEVLREPAGKELVNVFQLGPRESEPEPLEKWTGLKLEDMEAAVFGLRLSGGSSRTVLILQTRRPYNAEQVRSTLKAGKPLARGQRLYYHISAEGLPFQVLWCPASNVIFLGMAAEDLDAVPDTLAQGTDALPPSLKEMVDDQLIKEGQAWLAGRADNWSKIGMLAWPRWRLSRKDREALAQAQMVGIAVRFDTDMSVKVVLDCADAGAARRLEASVKRLGKDLPGFTAARSDGRVTARATAGVDAVRGALDWSQGRGQGSGARGR